MTSYLATVFHDPEYLKWCAQEFQKIRERRKSLKGKPDEYERIELALDKIFESFYKRILNNAYG